MNLTQKYLAIQKDYEKAEEVYEKMDCYADYYRNKPIFNKTDKELLYNAKELVYNELIKLEKEAKRLAEEIKKEQVKSNQKKLSPPYERRTLTN